MLSVQLSIIKLVFRDPCVVKARFVPWTQSTRHARLQLHLMSLLHAFEALGRVVQVGYHPSEDRCHPQSAAQGSSWIET